MDANPTNWTQILIAVIVALAGVIVFLFRVYYKRTLAMERASAAEQRLIAADRVAWTKERAAWDVKELRIISDHESEVETMRSEYEAKHRETIERQLAESAELRSLYQSREDAQRKEFADLMDAQAEQAARAAAALSSVLEKIYDRFIGPRPRRGG